MSGEPEGAKEAYGPFHRSLITVHCTSLHPRYPIVMRRAILTQPLGIIAFAVISVPAVIAAKVGAHFGTRRILESEP